GRTTRAVGAARMVRGSKAAGTARGDQNGASAREPCSERDPEHGHRIHRGFAWRPVDRLRGHAVRAGVRQTARNGHEDGRGGAGELGRMSRRAGEMTWLDRLWYVEALAQALPSSLARTLTPFGFVRMSADCSNALGLEGRDTPARKLSGLQIGHFGGFLKRS